MESAHKKFIDSALVKHMDLPSARVEESQKSKTIQIEIESDESETIVEKFDVGTTPGSEFKSVKLQYNQKDPENSKALDEDLHKNMLDELHNGD